MSEIENLFTDMGGVFITPSHSILEKLKHIKAFIFDWDGVFNPGIKGSGLTSCFSEADAMGTNLLRFDYWLTHNEMPYTVVLTGENNQSAIEFVKREHFNAVYFKCANKAEALLHLEQNTGILPSEIAFFFDDVLDIPVAKVCGIGIFVRRKAGPVFSTYVTKKKLCDYMTASEGGQHAVREGCELMMGLKGTFDKVAEERIEFSKQYRNYLSLRNGGSTDFFIYENGKINQLDQTLT